MIYKCNKCREEFISQYLLTKHENRKISCDIVLECIKCLKVFPTSQGLERHYSRLNLCVSTAEYKKRIKKEEKKKENDRQKQIELENKMKLLKFKHELELETLKHKEIMLDKRRNADIDMYTENNKIKKANELEIASFKLSKRENIELIKTERKGKTAQIINNNVTINNTNICINYIKDNFMENASLSFNSLKRNSMDRINNKFSYSPDLHKKALRIIQKYDKINDIIAYILRYTFDNKKFPDERCIYYINKKYFAITILDSENQTYDFDGDSKFDNATLDEELNDASKDVKEIDFVNDLLPVIKNILKLYIEKLVDILVTAYNFKSDSNEHMTCDMIKRYIQDSLNASSTIADLEKLSNKVFETVIPEQASDTVC